MRIHLNGQPAEIPDGATITRLLEHLNVAADGTAVALNDTVVRKAAWPDTLLRPDDHVEIIHAVAGG